MAESKTVPLALALERVALATSSICRIFLSKLTNEVLRDVGAIVNSESTPSIDSVNSLDCIVL